MTLNKTLRGETLVYALEGRLDTTTAPELEADVKTSLDGVTELIFNLKNLEYISSAGLRVLMTAQKLMEGKGEMTLTHPNKTVLEVFEITGFDSMLTVKK